MAYYETFTPIHLIRWLSRERYAGLPAGLFDRYLWFYKELERVQYQIVYAGERPAGRLFINRAGGDPGSAVSGIGYLEKTGNQLKLLIDAANPDGLADFIGMLKAGYPLTRVTLNTAGLEVGQALAGILGWECQPDTIKLYTETLPPAEIGPAPTRELFSDDEALLQPFIPRRWPAYQTMLKLGYRFFGLIKPNGRLVSLAGLVQLTGLRSEIIGVETFAEIDRGQGYASAACALALKAGLANTQTVTWSTRLDNPASVALAQKLGFKAIGSLYKIDGLWD